MRQRKHYGIGQSSCQAVYRDAGQHDSRVCRCVGVGPSRGDGLERMPEQVGGLFVSGVTSSRASVAQWLVGRKVGGLVVCQLFVGQEKLLAGGLPRRGGLVKVKREYLRCLLGEWLVGCVTNGLVGRLVDRFSGWAVIEQVWCFSTLFSQFASVCFLDLFAGCFCKLGCGGTRAHTFPLWNVEFQQIICNLRGGEVDQSIWAEMGVSVLAKTGVCFL